MKKNPIIVIKLGTSSIVHETTHQPLLSTLALIVETAVSLRKNGYRVVLVSSGAIGIALQKMHLDRRPKLLPQIQALAAIGQCRLMGLWEEMFERLGQTVAQILLTRNDIADRTQYLNAQNTFTELLNMGVIPIVNENDTLGVTEIKFGDNDTLSAITAGMVSADYLFLMTDVDCLYDKNPRKHPDARPIEVVQNVLDLEVDVSSAGSALGTGGMSTKIVAARLATAAGVTTIITRSSLPGNIAAIVHYIEAKKAAQRASNGDSTVTSSQDIPIPPLHTRFLPSSHRIRDRHFWLLHGLTPHGTVYIDHGAAVALCDKAGLLPAGVIDVTGAFAQQECVRLVEIERPRKQYQSPDTPQTTDTSPFPSSTNLLAQLQKPSKHTPSASHSPSASTPATPPSIPSPSHTPNPSQHNLHTPTQAPVSEKLQGKEIGRALINYSAIEIKRIAGLRSTEIAHVLGYADTEYIAFRENIALTSSPASTSTTPAHPVGSETKSLHRHAVSSSSGLAGPAATVSAVAAAVTDGGREQPQGDASAAAAAGGVRPETPTGNLAGSMGGIDFEAFEGGHDGNGSSNGSGSGTPLPATPSEGRISMGLGGYVGGGLDGQM